MNYGNSPTVSLIYKYIQQNIHLRKLLGSFRKSIRNKREIYSVFLMIRHYDEAVRAFAVKRIQTWTQMTQLAIQMHIEDITFHQREIPYPLTLFSAHE